MSANDVGDNFTRFELVSDTAETYTKQPLVIRHEISDGTGQRGSSGIEYTFKGRRGENGTDSRHEGETVRDLARITAPLGCILRAPNGSEAVGMNTLLLNLGNELVHIKFLTGVVKFCGHRRLLFRCNNWTFGLVDFPKNAIRCDGRRKFGQPQT